MPEFLNRSKHIWNVLIFLGLLSSVYYANAESRCFLWSHEKGLVAGFEMRDIDSEWTWFFNPRTETSAEYEWSVEPGHQTNGIFKGSGLYFSYFVGTYRAGAAYAKKVA